MGHGRASTCRSTFENAKASKNSLNPELHLKKGFSDAFILSRRLKLGVLLLPGSSLQC